MEDILFTLGVLAGLTALSALFVIAEMAMATARRSRLQVRAEDGDAGSRAALELQDNPNRFLSTVQIFITLLGTLIAAWSGPRLEVPLQAWLGPWFGQGGGTVAFILVVGAITYVQLVLAELVPKRLALQSAEPIASFLARPMVFISQIARPLVLLLSFSTEAILWILRRRSVSEEQVTTEDIRQMVREGAEDGTVQAHEERIIESVFRLGERKVRQVRTPRTDVKGLDLLRPVSEQLEAILANGYSRLPAYEGDLDHLVGILMVKDLLRIPLDGDVRSLLRPTVFVHEGSPAVLVLKRMQREKIHMAVVIDEHGAFEGVVSLEDLLEEIVGEIEDEDDENGPELVESGRNEWTVEGSMSPDRLREVLERRDPFPGETEGHYDTVAGFVLERMGRIPAQGDRLAWEDLEIEITQMEALRIEMLCVRRVGG